MPDGNEYAEHILRDLLKDEADNFVSVSSEMSDRIRSEIERIMTEAKKYYSDCPEKQKSGS